MQMPNDPMKALEAFASAHEQYALGQSFRQDVGKFINDVDDDPEEKERRTNHIADSVARVYAVMENIFNDTKEKHDEDYVQRFMPMVMCTFFAHYMMGLTMTIKDDDGNKRQTTSGENLVMYFALADFIIQGTEGDDEDENDTEDAQETEDDE